MNSVPKTRRKAAPAALLSLGLLVAAGCDPAAQPEPGKAAPAAAARRQSPPVAAARRETPPVARQAAPVALTGRGRLVNDCVEENLRGPGYDDLHPRDARRRLFKLQVQARCEERVAR